MAAKIKTLKTVVVSIILLLAMCGCYDSKEIDDLAYASAIGLDTGKTNELKMTVQIMVPKDIGAGAEAGGGERARTVTTTTVETPTIYSGLNLINNYISKQLNLSHAKLLVISEELARKGIQKYLYSMIRGRQFRGNMYIAVSKCSAEKYLNNVNPRLEANPSKYFELRHSAFKYTAFTADTTLINLYMQETCTCSQAVATLVSVSRFNSSEEFNMEDSTYRQKNREKPLEGDYEAGHIPQKGEVSDEIMGLAVFDGDTMVGELDGQETTYYLMLVDQFIRAFMTIEDPLDKENYIILDVRPRKKTVLTTEMIKGKPFCNAKLNLEADILSIQSGINYEASENLYILETAAEDFITTEIKRFLEKTSKKYNADICSFGKSLKMRTLLWEDWMKTDWLNKYEDAAFEVEVDLKLRRAGLIIRSQPYFSTEGEEFK